MSSSSNHNNGQREEIVDKLHGALSAFRKERDELHRKREVAHERLKVATEDREAAEKTVRALQDQLNQLTKSVSDDAKMELTKLEQEVEQLTRESQFQHNELVAKKDKIARLEAQMDEENKMREAAIRSARDAAQKRRNKTLSKPNLSAEQKVQRMEKELKEIGNESVWPKWPRLVEQKAAAICQEAADLHRDSEAMKRVIAGYQKQFGIVADEENAAVAMEQ